MTTEPKTPIWPSNADMSSTPHADTGAPPQPDSSTRQDEPLSSAERATERVAFAELIAFITEHKDPATELVHVSPDEFADALE